MTDRVIITLACFLAYCVMSGMLSPIGVILPPLAEYLGLAQPEAAQLFSWLTLGLLCGSAISLVVFDLLSLRGATLMVFSVIAVSLLTLYLTQTLWVMQLTLGAVGASCGIGLAAAASTISLTYQEDRRASMLVITDAAFSASGAATSALAVVLVAAGLHWSSVYLLVAGLAVVIVVLAAMTVYPRVLVPAAVENAPVQLRWPLPVWLCIGGLFCYTLGQYSMLWWLPTYLETSLGMARDHAGSVVSRYWSGMFFGQLFAAWFVLRVGARGMVVLSVIGTFFFSLSMWNLGLPAWLPTLAFAWGVVNFGLLKMVIAFASLAVARPTPRLIAALLFGATLGTGVSPFVSSTIAGAFGTLRVLQFASSCFLLLALLVLFARSLVSVTPAAGVGTAA